MEIKRFSNQLLGVYCCTHVFFQQRAVRLVGRQDGDWQFLCGESDHGKDPDEPYHVSVGFILGLDKGLNELADLPSDWEAEKVNDVWLRTRCGVSDA